MEADRSHHVLRVYLSRNGGSQQEFARAVGVTQGLVSKWLLGKKRITAERAIQIEQATAGAVTRHDLRPDLYPAEPATTTSEAA